MQLIGVIGKKSTLREAGAIGVIGRPYRWPEIGVRAAGALHAGVMNE
jgi:hypothetical protein